MTKETILQILNAYNLDTNKYGPSLYEKDNKYGICLDIKDTTFGYLTRAFMFDDKNELEDFLKKYIWYKNNHKNYEVTLSLDNYETKEVKIKYTYKNKELTYDDMLNLNDIIKDTTQNIVDTNKKTAYLLNIESLTNYLINLKNTNFNLKKEKNNLKIKENDLKYELLENLTIYYGKNKTIEKRGVSLDNIIIPSNDINLLKNNLNNIRNKSLEEMQTYLNSLINLVKEEELNEKNLINIYSNDIYKYNINILNKQIEFVKSKITAEKNFNLKGSKIHNIDEELKSFLKNNPAPTKINDYLEESKRRIENKYVNLTDLTTSYTIITGKPLDIPTFKLDEFTNEFDLNYNFNELNQNIKNSLILYNSFYKNICNYILENNPTIEDIKNNFDFTYYYQELDDIIHNENNNHYLLNYFTDINFKSLDTYIQSIINIANIFKETQFTLYNPITVFSIAKDSLYKEMTFHPLYSNETTYIINIPEKTDIKYIPYKLQIDTSSNEINLIKTTNIYYKGIIEPTNEIITINKYHKDSYTKDNIIITKDLILDTKQEFYQANLKEN